MKKDKCPEKRKIKLDNEEIQEYYIDEKIGKQIAITKHCDKKIYVSKEFENKNDSSKKSIIYHERGHSNFIFWPYLFSLAKLFLSLFILSLLSLVFLVINLINDFFIFELPNLYWCLFLIIGIFFALLSISLYWFLEIISDINVPKKYRKILIGEIIRKYNNFSFIQKIFYLFGHPSPCLRKRILEDLD